MDGSGSGSFSFSGIPHPHLLGEPLPEPLFSSTAPPFQSKDLKSGPLSFTLGRFLYGEKPPSPLVFGGTLVQRIH
jgi:hypothetical protein